MGNPFETIADTISDFAGDVADAWNGVKPDATASSTYLSYPYDLGNGTDTSVDFNSDVVTDIDDYSDARASAQKNSYTEAGDPFIMFEFLRVIEKDHAELAKITTAINAANATISSDTTNKNLKELVARNKAGAAVKETLEKRKDFILDSMGDRKVRDASVIMYMTPAISINDSMSYEQESRKLAAMGGQVTDAWDKDGLSGVLDTFSGEDVAVGLAVSSAAVIGGAIAAAANAAGGIVQAAGTAGGAGLGQAIGDEAMRRMGKALNPNEYMQYKNTQLRSFTFTWKMLPDSVQESIACERIIIKFRGAAHAHRKSSVTLTVPDQIVTSFHGVDGMVNMPPTVISNVSVTYNPNAASFFKSDGRPVEIDLSITLNEIMPIYRDDVETKGY